MTNNDDTSSMPPSLLGSKEEIITKRFVHLRGQSTNAYKASKETDISQKTFLRWARAGYIRILNAGKRESQREPLELDAADVAYCVHVYRNKKKQYGGDLSGVRLFDQQGNPFELKKPERSRRFGNRSKTRKAKEGN